LIAVTETVAETDTLQTKSLGPKQYRVYIVLSCTHVAHYANLLIIFRKVQQIINLYLF